MRSAICLAWALISSSVICGDLFAHGCQGCGYREQAPEIRNNQAAPPYAAEVVKGTVARVYKTSTHDPALSRIYLIINTGKRQIPVDAGPGWFLESQQVKILVGDQIEVKGTGVSQGNEFTLLADEIKKGKFILKLRDKNGLPMWEGWKEHGSK